MNKQSEPPFFSGGFFVFIIYFQIFIKMVFTNAGELDILTSVSKIMQRRSNTMMMKKWVNKSQLNTLCLFDLSGAKQAHA